MTKEDLDRELEDLQNLYSLEKSNIVKRFCDANNLYQIGDIFIDHIGKIKIEKVGYEYGLGKIPYCVYFGTELKKDGTPRKDGSKRRAWQFNDIKNELQNN